MDVLIVESQKDLGMLWKAHMERQGMQVTLACSHQEAIQNLTDHAPDMIILDLVLPDGNALAISDFAGYRHPDARVIFVTNTSFFSDGSIFAHADNACAFVQCETPPEDLTAMVQHYAVAH